MKSKAIVSILTILVVSLTMYSFAFSTASSEFETSFDVMMYREEFAFEFDEDSMVTSGLPEVTPFNIDMVDAEWVSNDGEDVYVAVLDTGLLPWWEFFFSQANIRDDLGIGFRVDIWWQPGVGFVRGPSYPSDFITKVPEGSGHGTHVTSTIVGFNVNNAYWVRGVAPKAQIIPVLVLDAWNVSYPGGYAQFTGGFDDQVAAGIYYVADLAETLDGPVIISMSLGGPAPSSLIEDAIDYAISKGVVVVASAGNEGYAGMGWPGAYPQVISCGMAGWTEQFLDTSSGTLDFGFWRKYDVPERLNTEDFWGNNWQIFLDDISSRPNKTLGQKAFHLDVTTPGAAVVGPYKPYFSYDVNYYYLWGTSMAAPHVSGIAALVLQNYPSLAQSSVERILKVAANRLPIPSDGSWAWDPWYGTYHFEWVGDDWGSGFLQADSALFFSCKKKSKGAVVP
jgi:subtilisin family serine protease